MIWRGAACDEIVAVLPPAFGAIRVLPVLPRPVTAAIRVLVQAEKDSTEQQPENAPQTLIVADGKPAQAAEEILRAAQPLAMAAP